MGIFLWFVVGLIVVAVISYAAFRWYQLKTERQEPLPAEKLPTDWDRLMPKERRPAKKQTGDEPSFRRIGVKKNGNGGILNKLK